MAKQSDLVKRTIIGVAIIIAILALVSLLFRDRTPALKYGETVASVQEVVDKLVKVRVIPDIPYRFDIMQPRVQQHLDRAWTYDTIPPELLGGILFQGIHEPVKGTTIELELLTSADIYFFFHHASDGGYTDIFPNLEGWKRSESAPQYDIHNGTHGLNMIMYHLDANAGIYTIPATTKDKACLSIVFQAKPLGGI